MNLHTHCSYVEFDRKTRSARRLQRLLYFRDTLTAWKDHYHERSCTDEEIPG